MLEDSFLLPEMIDIILIFKSKTRPSQGSSLNDYELSLRTFNTEQIYYFDYVKKVSVSTPNSHRGDLGSSRANYIPAFKNAQISPGLTHPRTTNIHDDINIIHISTYINKLPLSGGQGPEHTLQKKYWYA